IRSSPSWRLLVAGAGSLLAVLALAQLAHGADLKERARSALVLEKPGGPASCVVQQPEPCPPSKFRSASGECNNFNHRHWGARGDPFIRLLQPDYADGRVKPRTSLGSHALPAPDTVIAQLQRAIEEKHPHPHVTAMLPAWGQLLAYDLVQILSPNSRYRCCHNASHEVDPAKDEAAQCYVRLGDGCREYKRSIPSHEPTSCEFHYREQMNAASGFLDGSGLYGTTEKEIHALRTFLGGKVDTGACLRCQEPGAIGALHTVLLKEHNRVADQLAHLNPEWSDTTLFYETRRIVMAQIQHITYNEFLPIVLGSQITENADLRLESGRHYTGYSSANRAGMFAEVAVGALPAFLTMLPPDMYNESMSADILLATPAMQQTFIPEHASFNNEWTPISLAIQRGRDHGVPAYHKAINLCETRFGAKPFGAKLSFDDMEYFGLSRAKRTVMETMYQEPEDIDLLIGGLMETPALGTVFGPTLTCLLAIQFANMRSSDRFWYENDLPPSSLSLDQLQAIRRVTLSGLLCETRDVQRAQPRAFIREDPYLNARLNCEQLAGLDLKAWHSEQPDLVEEYTQDEQPTPPEFEELNMDLIAQALNKAKSKLNERKQQEYQAWVKHRGVDAKSPDGTAASFSKANRNALIIANTSLFYELATNEIVSSLHSLRRRKRQVFDNNLGGFSSDDFSNALQNVDVNQYENEDPVVKFTEAQLAEIRKTTLAKIICENLDVTGDMQRAAFDLPSNFLNPRVPCSSMAQIDLSAWRENVVQGCQIGGKNVNVGDSAFPSPCTSCICTNEGPQCASLRITDCSQLAREWPRDVILRDDVCSAQCGLVLQNSNAQARNVPISLRPPPQRIARSRIVQQQQASPFSFQGFQFPDLSQFIG
uniref:Uncharacterized protein n=1 Tax=Anopheles albimanus TaxID=7167 RepID=A0A182F4S5_ANOAL